MKKVSNFPITAMVFVLIVCVLIKNFTIIKNIENSKIMDINDLKKPCTTLLTKEHGNLDE